MEVVYLGQVLHVSLVYIRANFLHCVSKHILRNYTDSLHVILPKLCVEVLVVSLNTIYDSLHNLSFISMRNIASVWLELLRSTLNVNLSQPVLIEHLVDAFYDRLIDGDAV